MKKLQFMLVVMLSSSLIFSGCSGKEARYKGQTKADWEHIYVEYENSKKQRSATIKQRNRLQKKCIKKTEDGRISYSLACTKQLKELNENVKYWNDVVISRGSIIESLDNDQQRINAQEAEESRQTMAKIWSRIKTTVSLALLVGTIIWLADADTNEKDSIKFNFSF